VASSAAKRYAQAVFDLARERGTLDAWQADLNALAALAGDPLAANYLANPSVPRERKFALVDKVLAGGQPEARNLARLLVERDRAGEAPRIAELFAELLRAERGVAIAEVTTAEPLSPASEALVRDKLQRLVGKQIELRVAVDPSIIGGLVARVGDMVIDGSAVGQLRKLRARLAAAS
jgi:F-type H+-transporting ATPase subunit delta